jgi:hypothetical protein
MSHHMNGEAFDIGELKSTDTAEVAINHPVTGSPTTWVWTLAGPGHQKSIEASNIAARDAIRLQRAREQAVANRRKWVEPERTPEEMRLENAKSFAMRVLSWTPARINGEDYPFSQENVVSLLMNPSYGKVYIQLLEYFTSDESFTARSAMTSSTTQSESLS